MADFNPGHEMTHQTFGEMLLARLGDHRAGLMVEQKSWTWDEFVRECAVRAALLSAWAGEHRDRVAARAHPRHRTLHVGVLLDNVPEYLFLLGGAALSGVTIIGVNPTRRGAELAADIRGVDCDVLVTSAAGCDRLAGLENELGLAGPPIDFDSGRYRDAIDAHAGAAGDPAREFTDAGRDEGTYLSLMFTSGSTGAPKAVICSTGRMAMLGQVNFRGLVPDDVAYSAMPLFHGNAIMGVFAPCVSVGCTFTMRERFSASNFLSDVRRFGATFVNYVGRSLAYILAIPESELERDTKLRIVFGTEASAHDRAEFTRRFGVAPSEAYGSSEGGAVIQRTPDSPPDALGRSGDFMDIAILDRTGGTVCPPARFDSSGAIVNADEAIGEIVNRTGARMFEGYYNNPEAAAERVSGSAFHTGDLGYTDAEGFIYFAGRAGDRLRVNSENFSAAPVERILSRFPGAVVVAVYPVPDPRTGDAVMATFQMRPGHEFDPVGFAQFLAEQSDLAATWRPRFIRLIESMPTTATRKIAKPELRRQSWLVPDPVFTYDGGRLVPLDDAGARALREEYARHDRSPSGF